MSESRILLLAALSLLGCYGSTTLEGDAADTNPDAAEAEVVPDDAGVDAPEDGSADEDSFVDVLPEDVPLRCLPQDARPSGPCAAELPGVVWNGTNCLPLGSGCSCDGADCGGLYETLAECVRVRRDCYHNNCAPQAVADNLCLDCTAEMLLGVFWDGRDCYELHGCDCLGDGCYLPFRSLEECETFHETCPAAVCAATGGSWIPEEYGGCGFACGGPRDADCYAPFADCLCPAGQTFDEEAGCAPDAACTGRDLCFATHGTWHPAAECFCGFHCGVPGDCDACLDSCDCGSARSFVTGVGCRVDPGCEPEWGVDLCTSTGGTWHDCSPGDPFCSCGDYHCGRPNVTEPCVMPGCDCGSGANFGSEGCVPDAECFFGVEGEECNGWGRAGSTCRPGLTCCVECGMMVSCNYCRNPCCGDSPSCDENGCPPPPP